jgi:hypothetical protein
MSLLPWRGILLTILVLSWAVWFVIELIRYLVNDEDKVDSGFETSAAKCGQSLKRGFAGQVNLTGKSCATVGRSGYKSVADQPAFLRRCNLLVINVTWITSNVTCLGFSTLLQIV